MPSPQLTPPHNLPQALVLLQCTIGVHKVSDVNHSYKPQTGVPAECATKGGEGVLVWDEEYTRQ